MRLRGYIRTIVVVALATVGTTLTTSGAHANGGPFTEQPDGGAITATGDSLISLDRVTVMWEDGVMNARFQLTNHSETPEQVPLTLPVFGDLRELAGGFRDRWASAETEEARLQMVEELFALTITIDGAPTENSLVSGEQSSTTVDYDYAFVTEVSFAAGQTREVVTTYRQQLDRWADERLGVGTLQYMLRTGGGWHGPIGEVRVEFRGLHYERGIVGVGGINNQIASWAGRSGNWGDPLIANDVLRVRPDPWPYHEYRLDARPEPTDIRVHSRSVDLIWQFADLEPDFNIEALWVSSALRQRFASTVANRGHAHPFGFLRLLQYQLGLSEDPPYRRDDSFFSYRSVSESYLPTLHAAGLLRLHAEFYYHIALRVDLADLSERNREQNLLFARYAINALYAHHNYRFSNPAWNRIFYGDESGPETALDGQPVFSDDEQRIIDELIALRESAAGR